MNFSQYEESNTQYDQPPTQVAVYDYDDDNDEKCNNTQQCWASLVSRSVNGIRIELRSIPAATDDQDRCNLHLLGRGNQCNIKFLSSPRISNKHCMIYCKYNYVDKEHPRLEAWIEDLSANGTFINRSTRLVKNIPR